MVNKKGWILEGWIDQNDANGQGRLITSEGYYVGNFKDSEFDGIGKNIFNKGGRYEGEYKENQRDGWGTLKFADGSIFTGDFEKGM